MRRQTNRREIATTNRDVGEANRTLNKLVGGQQRSWMTDSFEASSRPARPAPAQNFQPQRHNAAPVPSTIPPAQVLDSARILESPTPEPEQVRSATGSQYGTLISPRLSDPIPWDVQGVSQAQTGVQSFSPSPVIGNGASHSRSNSSTQSISVIPQRQSLQGAGPEPQPVHGVETWQTHQPPRDNQPQTSFTPTLTTPNLVLPSTMIPGNSAGMPNGHPVSHKRPRLDASAMAKPNLIRRIISIEQHLFRYGGLAKLNPSIDAPRFELLKTACEHEDFFYIVLHQLFCVYHAHKQETLQYRNYFPDPVVLDRGMTILSDFLRSNRDLNSHHLKFFCNFPSPFSDLIRISAPYQQKLVAVGDAIQCLGKGWDNFSQACVARGYPPLVDELTENFHLASSQLQEIIFTASRRNIGLFDDGFTPKMTSIFHEDQAGHQALLARMNTASPPSLNEISTRTKDIINRYIAIKRQRDIFYAQQAASDNGQMRSQQNFMNMSLDGSGTSPSHNPSLPVPPRTRVLGSSPDPTAIQSAPMPSPHVIQYSAMPQSLQSTYSHSPRVQSGQHILRSTQLPNSSAMNQMRNQTQGQARVPQQYQQQSHVRAEPVVSRNVPNRPNASRQTSVNTFCQYQPPSNPIENYGKMNPSERPLVPPLGYIHAPQPIDPNRSALHLAHLRSPRLVAISLSKSENTLSTRLYQAVKEFTLCPSKVPSTNPLMEFTFEVTLPVARDTWLTHERRVIRNLEPGIMQYRLRSIKTTPDDINCTMSVWTTTRTSWPETVFLELNDKNLEIRRKALFGEDKPVDITPMVLRENRLRICIPRATKDRPQTPSFLIAVEAIDVLKHQQILDMCLQQRIPAETTMNGIMKSLAGPDSDDDDFAVVPSDLHINLTDPFTSRIYDIPARGRSCVHRECFDLETFLQTRSANNKRADQPCVVDCWKCPICLSDARPYTLQVDDFFVLVRAKLVADNLLDTKTILVSGDGSWRPKPEEPKQNKRKATAAAFDEPDSENEDQWTRSRGQSAAGGQTVVEVIDLDSD